jgi:hypothetical protein
MDKMDRMTYQLLLETGVDVNRQDEAYPNTLQATSFEGRKNMVQLLLEMGPMLMRKLETLAAYFRRRQQEAMSRWWSCRQTRSILVQ